LVFVISLFCCIVNSNSIHGYHASTVFATCYNMYIMDICEHFSSPITMTWSKWKVNKKEMENGKTCGDCTSFKIWACKIKMKPHYAHLWNSYIKTNPHYAHLWIFENQNLLVLCIFDSHDQNKPPIMYLWASKIKMTSTMYICDPNIKIKTCYACYAHLWVP
jgi:hypothetical protein